MTIEDEATSKPVLTDDLDEDFDDGPEEGVEHDITDDGGIKKTILTKGEGWEKPEKGDKVTVHYVGTLEDGSKFDSSRDRDDPFVFTLGTGQVIKGWDEGVATMKRGEKCILKCTSDYAYGAQGSPPKIPPGATLNFEVELLDWSSVKDILGNGGVIKTIIAEPSGWQKPTDLDEVHVVYSIHQHTQGQDAGHSPVTSGKMIYETGQEGVCFSTKAVELAMEAEGKPASPHMLKGIVEAVKTMKKGEIAELVLQPEYAYGSEGFAPDVPPETAVAVHLELVRWKAVEDILDDGGVIKKTTVDPQEQFKTPNEGASCTIRYTGRLSDGSIFDQKTEGEGFKYTTDEGQLPEGLDRAIMRMKKGEVALVTLQPQYAFGKEGCNNFPVPVPADETVCYEVELVEFTNAKESWEMKDEEKVAAAAVKKEKGNKAFKEGNLKAARTHYDKAVSTINYDKNFTDDLKAQSKDLKKSCWLNLAAVQLKLKDYTDVKSNCGKVLQVDPSNIKALYRRAQAYVATQDFLEAEVDVKAGLLNEPQNAELLHLHKRIKALQKDQNAKAAKMYSKMFAPSKKEQADATKEETAPSMVEEAPLEVQAAA